MLMHGRACKLERFAHMPNDCVFVKLNWFEKKIQTYSIEFILNQVNRVLL